MARQRRTKAEMVVGMISQRRRLRSPLLSLPNEIILKICHYTFLGHQLTVCGYNKDHTEHTFSPDEVCQILLTCHKLYDAAMPLMYKLVNFHIAKESSWSYFSWSAADEEKLQLVKKITFSFNLWQTEMMRKVNWAMLPSLETLYVRSVNADFSLGQTERQPWEDGVAMDVLGKVWRGQFMSTRVVPYLPLRRRFRIVLFMGLKWMRSAVVENGFAFLVNALWVPAPQEMVELFEEECKLRFDDGRIEKLY